jgi:chromosome segregation ATPase
MAIGSVESRSAQEKLQLALFESQTESSKRSDECKRLQDELERFRTLQANSEHRIQQLESSLSKLQSEHDSLVQSNEQSQRTLKAVRDDFISSEKLQSQQRQQLQLRGDEVDRLTLEVTRLSNENQQLSLIRNRLDGQLQDLNKRFDASKIELQRLSELSESQASELEKSQKSLSFAEAEVEHWKSESQIFSDELAKSKMIQQNITVSAEEIRRRLESENQALLQRLQFSREQLDSIGRERDQSSSSAHNLEADRAMFLNQVENLQVELNRANQV